MGKHVSIVLLLLATNLWAQDTDSLKDVAVEIEEPKVQEMADNAKYISLQDALDMGLRRNAEQKARHFTFSKISLDWEDIYQSFWFPKLSLTLSSDSHRVDNLYRDDTGTSTGRTPDGYVGLEFDDFTVFNWGKDYLDYLNGKANYTRQKQVLDESRRKLRFDLIEGYFNISRLIKLVKYRKDQVRHTSFLYRLVRERVQLRKTKLQELYQMKEEFLRSQEEYQQALNDLSDAEDDFAKLLGDNLEQTYRPTEDLLFKTFSLPKSVALKKAQDSAPLIRTARTNLNIANNSFEKNLKERLPLPKIDLKLGAYRHNFSNTGAKDIYSTDGDDNRNVELVASVNMKWTIFGDGGWFNSRDTQRVYISKKQAEISFQEAIRYIDAGTTALNKQIKYLERKMAAAELRIKNSRTSFDKVMDSYMGGKTSFANMKLAIDALNLSQNEFENTKFQHLSTKLTLANLIGIDDIPGENFENLVEK